MKISESLVLSYIQELASNRPTPGGGSAAALTGSMAASLVAKVGNLTHDPAAQQIAIQAENLARKLLDLADDDAEAFQTYIKAPKAEKQRFLKQAVLVPLETASDSYTVLKLAEKMADIGNPRAITDTGVAALCAAAAVEGAMLNVVINLNELGDAQFTVNIREKMLSFGEVDKIKESVLARVKEKIDHSA